MQKLLIPFLIVLVSCQPTTDKKAQRIIDKAIQAHGQLRLTGSKINFTFRDKDYQASRTKDSYTYSRLFVDSTDIIEDILVNGKEFYRLMNDDTIKVKLENERKWSESLNSVLYFLQLPFLLNDTAVIKRYSGTIEINDMEYHIVKVNFTAENGGEDFDDEYLFWIDAESYLVDYLAYNYSTDGGGVRFREAYNRHTKGGILFQDYINHEVPLGTDLDEIPKLFEEGKLKELSRIENTKVSVNRIR